MRFSARRSLFALHNGSRSVNWHQTRIGREIRRKSTLCYYWEQVWNIDRNLHLVDILIYFIIFIYLF